jgi:hypothetical protein
VIAHVENARDPSAAFSRTDHLRRSAAAEQQPECVHNDRFATARFAREQVQAGVKVDAKPLDYRIVLDYQFEEHGLSRL